MHGVRDYFRMVVRKVLKYPAAQADEELRKDVTELFECVHFLSRNIVESASNFDLTSNLVDVQRTLLKLKRENRHIGSPSRLLFAQRDKERLDALKLRVQESRNMFEVRFLSSLTTLS